MLLPLGGEVCSLQLLKTMVSSSLQLMRREFKLVPRLKTRVCRHGHNACVQYLRLAYREHRLMAWLLRIRSYVLHHTLLLGLAGVQHVPPRFRSAEH